MHATQRQRAILRMDACVDSILSGPRNRLAIAFVQNRNSDHTGSRTQNTKQALRKGNAFETVEARRS